MSPRVAHKNPLVVEYDRYDVLALQALQGGTATEVQQKRCLDLIVNGIACAYDVTFRPDSARLSDFASGKAFVGQQIDKLLRINPAKMKDKPDGRSSTKSGN